MSNRSLLERGGKFPQFLSFWTFYKPFLLFSIQSFTSFLKWIQNTFQNHEKLKNCGNFLPLSNMDHLVVFINGHYIHVVHNQIHTGSLYHPLHACSRGSCCKYAVIMLYVFVCICCIYYIKCSTYNNNNRSSSN